MIYLKEFYLPDENNIGSKDLNVYNNHYPLGIFPDKNLNDIKFDTITIFYGGNGSGKTTLLNLIGQKISAERKNINDLGPIFDQMVKLSNITIAEQPNEIKLIFSDDVFDVLLDERAYNSKINRQKTELMKEYFDLKYNYTGQQLVNNSKLIEKKIDANRLTASKYIRNGMKKKNVVIQQSNGEQALDYWQDQIWENGLYLIDEPENSLSAENQMKLKKYIEDFARFFNCQFIIATHSPFILSLNEARIVDLDSDDVNKYKKWFELENVRAYYNLFKEHEDEFQ